VGQRALISSHIFQGGAAVPRRKPQGRDDGVFWLFKKPSLVTGGKMGGARSKPFKTILAGGKKPGWGF